MKANRRVLGHGSLRVFLATSVVLASWGGQRALAAPDPGVMGPHLVMDVEYDLGDQVFTPSDLSNPVEIRAVVHHPTPLPAGQLPLVVFLHGRHGTCFQALNDISASMQWPCSGTTPLPIPSYRGYDYAAAILASHGYIVVSISANGINAQDGVPDGGALARAELIQEHLHLWKTFNTAGGDPPIGNTFVGKVDLNNIGTMGHSRGGEGVVRHFLLNAGPPSPYGIRAVFPLAPTNFERFVINDVPLAVLLPYCDGDVDDLQGVRYYDDARYNVPGDTAAKHTILVLGANHNFYNTVWTPSLFTPGTIDDWHDTGTNDLEHCGGKTDPRERLTATQQQGTGIAYLTAFFRTYLGGETQFLPLLTSDDPPPPSAMTDGIFLAYLPPDDPALRRDVNRLLENAHLSTNTLGGAASQSGLTPYDLCGGPDPQPDRCLDPDLFSEQTEPHAAPLDDSPGLSQLRCGWDSPTATYQNELPAGARDVSGFFALQFRASVNFTDSRNPAGMDQDLTVTLSDGAGLTASAPVGGFSSALFYPPGEPDPAGATQFSPVPRVVQNTVRIPLSAFTDIFLTDIRSIRFAFDQQATGALLISEVAFADQSPNSPPRVSCSVEVPLLLPGQHKLENVGLAVEVADDFDADLPSTVLVFGDEEDEAPTDGAVHSPDAKDVEAGSLRLRAERVAESDGRVYLLLVTAQDPSGLLGYDCCSVVVPHNQSATAISSVQAQAAAAESLCTGFAAFAEGLGPLPSPYVVIGDGPVVGPKQ